VILARSFFINAVSRIVVRQYWEGGRDKVSEALALTANYRVNEYLTVSAVSRLAAPQSNQSVFDYQVANIGGDVAFVVKFRSYGNPGPRRNRRAGPLTRPLESRPINLVEINQRNAMFKSVGLGIFARTCNGLVVIGHWS